MLLCDLVFSNRRFVGSCSLYIQNKVEAVTRASSWKTLIWFGPTKG